MAARSTITIALVGQDQPPAGCMTGQLQVSASQTARIENGNASNQANVILCRDSVHDGQIAASGNVSINLTTALDRFGVALALTDIAVLYLKNKTADATIVLEPGAAQPLDTVLVGDPGGTDVPGISLPPGAFVVLGGYTLGTWAVSGGANDTIRIRETGGVNPADYELQIWGRRP